ncbi:unnamed protein product [Dracunculus medinensis]|uniref:Uncharacterized protein n=1 Tax=Dracunculus medinensis TaxID=318479 RepID=A0A0N4UFQ8_DRAME|nr:unnamed protein product [Dracunculus medinensis]
MEFSLSLPMSIRMKQRDFLQCDLVTFDYSGYGFSTGQANESSVYESIIGVYRYISSWREITNITNITKITNTNNITKIQGYSLTYCLGSWISFTIKTVIFGNQIED